MSTIPQACFSVHIRMGDPPPIFRYCSCIRGVRLLAMIGASLLRRGEEKTQRAKEREKQKSLSLKQRKISICHLCTGRGMRSLSRNSLRRKSCTSSVVSGPPRFNISIPVLGFASVWLAPLLKRAWLGLELTTGHWHDERSALAAFDAILQVLMTDEQTESKRSPRMTAQTLKESCSHLKTRVAGSENRKSSQSAQIPLYQPHPRRLCAKPVIKDGHVRCTG